MIPKIIHYCWFGRNPLPKLAKKCIKSWKKHCPDYKIIQWNEDNYDLSAAPLYVRQAYEAKKWAFVADYVRLQVVYDHGGIYMDTDVELCRSPNEMLHYKAYFGFEGGPYINTGLGFGAEQGSAILKEMMDDYEHIPFILEDGEFDLTTCSVRNADAFLKRGFVSNHETQILEEDICILSPEWLCPFSDWTGVLKRTKNTLSIHWYSASWQSETYKSNKTQSVRKARQLRRRNRLDKILHFPNRMVRKLLGDSKYEAFKNLVKKGKKQ